jgi:hypothetical protein
MKEKLAIEEEGVTNTSAEASKDPGMMPES